MASNSEVIAERIEAPNRKTDNRTANDSEHHVYSNKVEMFLPKEAFFEVLINDKWETETPAIVSGSIKIYLEHSVLFIDKATITKTERGTKITTRHAKSTQS